MTDNTLLNPGIGGDLIATDDIGGVKWQWVKNAYGADGAVVPVTDTSPLPVNLSVGGVAVAEVDGGGVPVQIAPGESSSANLAGAGNALTIALKGEPVVFYSFAVNSFVGTIVTEGSLDGGVTYNTVLSGPVTATASFAGAPAVNANISASPTAGYSHFRIRCTAFTSGTCVVSARTSGTPQYVQMLNGSVSTVQSVSPGSAAASLGKAEDAPHTSSDVGVFSLGVRNDTEATTTSLSGDYSQLSVDGAGRLITTSKPTGFPSGTMTSLLSAATTNATNVKAASGNLYAIIATNFNAAARYLKFYNKASAPAVGTDIPVLRLPLLPLGAPPLVLIFNTPLPFSTGIGFGIVTGLLDSDTTAPTAGDVSLTVVTA